MYPSVGYRKQNYAAVLRVKRRLTISFCMFVFLLAGGLSPQVTATDVTPALSAGEWDNTIAVTTLGGRLYSIEKSGALYRTDLATGQWVQVGKAEFANTRFMFAHGQSLYTLEADGSLYRVSPANGAWSRVGEAGVWKNTIALVVLRNFLFTIERNGALYRTDLFSGQWVQVGKAEFANTRFIFAGGVYLYTIEADGSLYRVSPANGSWRKIGGGGTWKDTTVGTSMNGKIYTVERSGALYETNPGPVVWRQIGKPEFGKAQFLFAADGWLYSIEAGDLYRINASNGAWAKLGK